MIATPLMFAARVLEEVELGTNNSAEIDAPRGALELVTLELSEVLAGVASLYDVNLPDTDEYLLPVLRRYGRPVSGLARGIVGFTAAGLPGLGVGRGAVESDGEDLVHLYTVPDGRYVEFWTIPDITYWEASTK